LWLVCAPIKTDNNTFSKAMRGYKFRGGLSTGPKTLDDRSGISVAQKKRWAAWRNAKTA